MIRLLLLLALWQVGAADIYYVTFIKGTVRLSGSDKTLAVGDKLRDTDKIIFSTAGAKVSCISPVKGRFDISAGSGTRKVQSEWIGAIKGLLVQASTDHPLSTRDITGGNSDPAVLFKSSLPAKEVLLIENDPVKISNSYLIDADNFFFVKYTLNGNTVVKKVPAKQQSISFNSSLFAADKDPVMVSLCYQEIKNGTPTSRVVTKFTPVLLHMEKFKKEMDLLKTNLQSSSGKKIENELYNHFYTNYGHIDPALFTAMLEKAY